MKKDLVEMLEQYCTQEKLHCFEGRRGVEALCQVARSIGYKDSTYFGQLSHKAAIGDLIEMLQDNPGMIEAIITWIGEQHVPEWEETLSEQLQEDNEEMEE